MSIKRKLRLSVVATGGVALLVFGLTLAWISQQVSEALEQSKVIDKVVSGVFELHLITHDYLLHHEERAQAQWQVRYASLGQVLTGVETEDPEEQAILDQIMQDHAGLQPLFPRLVANYESRGLSEEEIALSLDVEQRLIGQLSVKAQTMVSQAFGLAETVSARVESVKDRGRFLLMASGVIMLALMVSAIVLASNTIVARITSLQRGAQIIAAGDFDYQVDVGSRDEIGDLAHAFNEMTRRLRESYGALKKEITERKRAGSQRDAALEALKGYSGRLEEMVEQRTKELREAQEQLVRREKLAVLGQLAGGVGHELRNPLGAIKNAAYFLNMVLCEADPDPDTLEMLEVLDKEVDSAEKIISSLLDFARPRPPVRRKVDVNDVVREALSRTPLPAAKRPEHRRGAAPRVEVVCQLDEDLPVILADPDQLSQVLGNLIRNGIQAMTSSGSVETPGDGRLVVRTARESPEWVTVSVADSGIGIAADNLTKIFEPLFTTKAKGIGLGLAVVKTLVEEHGGTIGVESRGGEGSTFTIRLPLDASAAIDALEE